MSRAVHSARAFGFLGTLLVLGACESPSPPAAIDARRGMVTPDAFLIVDCLLPGEVRQLGRRVTYATPRRPLKTTASECEIRGGEYVAYDRADHATALRVWQPAAEAGDPEAQTYVGEIYEKGLGVEADYARAADWYRRAAEQGFARAQIDLGQLYERGLGVPRDPARAMSLYRKGSGLERTELDYLPALSPAGPEASKLPGEAMRLRLENDRLREEIQSAESRIAALEAESRRAHAGADAARRELERDRQQVETERRALGVAKSDLAEQRERLTDRARLESADARRLLHDLDRREQELHDRSSSLREQEASLAPRQQQLDAQLAQLSEREREIEKQRREALVSTTANSGPTAGDADPAGPEIQLIEPQLPATRGVTVAAAESPPGERVVVGRVEAPAGLLALTVNDAETSVDARGIFESRVAVPESGSFVSIIAIDRRGRRASRTFRFQPAERSVSPQDRANSYRGIDFGRFHALVIGNDEYASLPDLATARNDARAIAELLRTRYGFAVDLLLDASRYEILTALNTQRAKLDEDDNFLLYYAGHGELDEANGRGHWLPADAEPQSTANWISNVAVTDILNAMSARHVLVIADSCYSGALTRSALARLDAGMSDEARRIWLRTMTQKRSRVALTSGGLAPVLDDGGGDHSIFAKILLEVLSQNTDVLEGARLHSQIAARVTWAADGRAFEQLPQYAPIRFAGHEAGDFFFRPLVDASQLDSNADDQLMAVIEGVSDEPLVVDEWDPSARQDQHDARSEVGEVAIGIVALDPEARSSRVETIVRTDFLSVPRILMFPFGSQLRHDDTPRNRPAVATSYPEH